MTVRGRAGALWLVTLVGVGAILHLAGTGDLAPPDWREPSRWIHWIEGVGPIAAAFAVLRLLAAAIWFYVVVATATGVVLRLLHADGLVAVVDRFTVPALRRLLAATLTSVTLAVPPSALAWAAPPAGPGVRSGGVTPTTAPASPGQGAGPTSPPPGDQQRPTLTMRRLPPGSTGNGADTSSASKGHTDRGAAVHHDGPSAAPEAPVGDPAAPGTSGSWTVTPGQSFWSQAETMVTDVRTAAGSSSPPPDGEVARYWLRLIEANRVALSDPANPDLIFPGQVFTLPGL